jgi:putative resolvase
MYKLSEYAKRHSMTYRGAYGHFKNGLISGAYQLPSGMIVIPDSYTPPKPTEYVITYSRVSSSENKPNLESQAERLASFCNAKGWIIREDIREIGSGLNDSRPKLLKLLKDGKASKIIVEHKDRLARFGVSFIEECVSKFGGEIIIINEAESKKEDLIQDFVSVITSFCAKIYGQRRSRRKTEALIKELENEEKI